MMKQQSKVEAKEKQNLETRNKAQNRKNQPSGRKHYLFLKIINSH
jgi:hypothetical protein